MLVRNSLCREADVIDPRAIVHPSARIGRDVHIGPWTLIDADVEIGDSCWIASHVVLRGPTQIGPENRIYQFATVGEGTPAFAYKGEPTVLQIGRGNIIREGVTIHRGMAQASGRTVIGDNNLFMAYAHVGQDCVVGSNVIMSNNASVSGHVRVGDFANLGGYAGVPQYRTIGASAMVGGMSLVLKDVPAYVLVSGNPAGAIGLNLEGMRRRGFDQSIIDALHDAYRVVYREGRVLQDALQALNDVAAEVPEVAHFIDSMRSTRFGIVRPRRERAAD